MDYDVDELYGPEFGASKKLAQRQEKNDNKKKKKKKTKAPAQGRQTVIDVVDDTGEEESRGGAEAAA